MTQGDKNALFTTMWSAGLPEVNEMRYLLTIPKDDIAFEERDGAYLV